MNKKLLPLLLAAVLLTPAALAAGFEGKVTMKMTGPKNSPPLMTFSIKEGFTRIDMATGEGRNAAVIMNAAKQEMTMLMIDQRMYMTQPMPKPGATATAAGAADAAAANAVEVTTTKEKILGYDCVKYVAQTKDGTSEIWVTDQLGPFMGFGGGAPMGGRRGAGAGSPPPQSWEAAIEGKGVFPMRVVTMTNGKESFRIEVTGIEKATLPDSLFAAPADFRSLGDMMRGMGLPGGIPGLPGGR